MAALSLIAAMTPERVIGLDGDMPWHLPADLAHFKRITSGKTVIMGRKTFDSIGRPLPKRRNIVITRNQTWHHDGVETVHSLEAAIALTEGEEETMIIGGATLYEAALTEASRLYITWIDAQITGDTHFPKWSDESFGLASKEYRAKDAKNAYNLTFCTYERSQID